MSKIVETINPVVEQLQFQQEAIGHYAGIVATRATEFMAAADARPELGLQFVAPLSADSPIRRVDTLPGLVDTNNLAFLHELYRRTKADVGRSRTQIVPGEGASALAVTQVPVGSKHRFELRTDGAVVNRAFVPKSTRLVLARLGLGAPDSAVN